MTELFHTDKSLSPRLEWMRRYDVRTRKGPSIYGGDSPWIAWMGEFFWSEESCSLVFHGETEDEAITALAKLMGWKLWNEEGYKL